MSKPEKNYYLHLKELLQRLQAHGLRIDVEHYSSIKKILEEYGPAVHPREMAGLLCPLLVTDQDEQSLFYQVFEQCVQEVETQLVQEEKVVTNTTPSLPSFSHSKKVLGIGLCFFLLVLSATFWLNREHIAPTINFQELTKTEKSTQKKLTGDTQSLPPLSKKDSISELTSAIEEINLDLKGKELEVDIPYRELSHEDMSKHEVKQLWWQKHKSVIKWWFAAMVFVSFILFELYHFNKNKIIARQKQVHQEQEPFVVDFDLEQDYAINYPMQDLHKLAYQMRKRTPIVQKQRIDVKATVNKTVASGGIIDLAYAAHSKAPQYLILIDQASKRDHQWALFEFISKALVKQDLHIHRYYFNSTPHQCWSEAGHQQVTLRYLQKHFPDHRVLIFGKAEHFIDSTTQQAHAVIQALTTWEEVMFLTAQHPHLWGAAEQLLSDYFPVMPADLKGLGHLIERFELVSTETLVALDDQGIIDLEDETEAVIANLEYYLLPHESTSEEANLLTWIAACCLLPTLHWDMTLLIGKVLSQNNQQNLLTVDNLTRLSKLSWFQEGHIPDRFRKRLLFDESVLPPALRLQVAAKIGTILEERMQSQSGTATNYQHRMHLLLCKWFGAETRKQQNTIRKQLQRLWLFSPQKDALAYEIMERMKPSTLDIIVPDSLRKQVFKDYYSFTGLRFSTRAFTAIVLILLPVIFIQSEFFCNHPISYKDTNYCIADSYTQAQLLNYKAVQEYQPEQENVSTTLNSLSFASSLRNGYNTSTDNRLKVYYNQLIYHIQHGNKGRAMYLFRELNKHPKSSYLFEQSLDDLGKLVDRM